MKKILAIMLALTIVMGLCACGGGSSSGGGKDGDKVTLSIGIPADAMVLDVETNALTKWVEEQTGYDLEFTVYPGGTDIATQITSTVFANQELPDILIGIPLDDETIYQFGRDKYFVDLTEYFEDKDGASKTFWDRMTTELSEADQDYIIEKMTSNDDGRIYTIPSVETSLVDSMYYQTWINTEWLDALGMSKPTNTDELYAFLKAVQEKDMNGNGDTEDEIPLLGSQKSVWGCRVLDWLLNLYTYYHTQHKWQPDADGKMVNVMTTDAYREGMKFIRKLYSEGLLSNMVYTTGDKDLKLMTTPSSGVATCGIFVGHLSVHVIPENELLYQYEPLQTWGYCAEKDTSVNTQAFITDWCENPEAAFEVMMLLWSKDGAMRQRYGEYNVDWSDADEGTVSLLGLPAEYKLHRDILMEQSSSNWGAMCTLNVYAEGETAQTPDDATEWTKVKSQMHAESRKLWDEQAARKNPENICPILSHTTEEADATESVRTNINNYLSEAEKNWVIGAEGYDINSDADWNAYLKKINDFGYDTYQKYVQDAYDRQ